MLATSFPTFKNGHFIKPNVNHGMKHGASFLTLFLLFSILSYTSFAQPAKRVPVIFDTDMGPDYDDVGAIALLHAMADSGECRILATIASNKHPRIVALLSLMNTYFKRPDIPVGVVKGNAVNLGAGEKWDSILVERYPHALKTNEEAADAVMLYRKLLAEQPDNSVTIVTVGFLTNIANLLGSPADKYSPLTGRELVKRKVRLLVSMAARFDQEMGKFKEFNVVKDSSASVIAFRDWPTHILFSGFEIGKDILTGIPIVNNPAIEHSPVKDVFTLCTKRNASDHNGRMSWDETAVLVAVRGYEKYFNVAHGEIVCNSNGTNGWNSAGTRDAYLLPKMPIPALETILNNLIMHQPG